MKLPLVFQAQIERAFNAGLDKGYKQGFDKGYEQGFRAAKNEQQKDVVISQIDRILKENGL